jgi:hypothetical protein
VVRPRQTGHFYLAENRKFVLGLDTSDAMWRREKGAQIAYAPALLQYGAMTLNRLAYSAIRRSVRSCLIGGALAALSLLGQSSIAHAASKAAKERAAKSACLSGDVAKGVGLLTDLYMSTDDITYIFNQGRCFEQNGKYEDAIARFREYERKREESGKPADPSTGKHIADCKAALLDATSPPLPAPAPPPLNPPSETTSEPAKGLAVSAPPSAESSPNVETKAQKREPAAAQDSEGAGLRMGGIVAMSTGVVGLAVGVIFNLKANDIASDLGRSDSTYSRSQDSSRSNYKRLSWMGYGVGATCLVGGAILYYVGYRQAVTGSVAIVPTVSPGETGLALQGAF